MAGALLGERASDVLVEQRDRGVAERTDAMTCTNTLLRPPAHALVLVMLLSGACATPLQAPSGSNPVADPAPARGPDRIPAGTVLHATLDTDLDSETSQVGQAVQATLTADARGERGDVVVPAGTRLLGEVTEVRSARKFVKKSILAFYFEDASLPDGRHLAVRTGLRLEGPGFRKRDGAAIGGSAAGGALAGQVLGGDSEATAVGAVIGGAIASGVVFGRAGDEVGLRPGTSLQLRLDADVDARGGWLRRLLG
jgi:hypothetical protein